MILVDTSIWIDHVRHGDPMLRSLLEQDQVLGHPFVIGELALGSVADGQAFWLSVGELPRAVVAYDDEVMGQIAADDWRGTGIGYVDAHLLTSARLTPGAMLWTRDKRLLKAAEQLCLAAKLAR